MRVFATGAIRDDDNDKLDFEGFLSPCVLTRYAEYMQKHQQLPGGTKRLSDNWQQGIPVNDYMKSLLRHVFDVWLIHRQQKDGDLEESLCATIFNAMGYLFEILKKKNGENHHELELSK